MNTRIRAGIFFAQNVEVEVLISEQKSNAPKNIEVLTI